MLLRWACALLHVAAGVALLGFSLLVYLLSGWGINEDTAANLLNLAPIPWLAVLAVPRFVAAWRAQGSARRTAFWLAVVCGVLAVATLALMTAATGPCPPHAPPDPRIDVEPCHRMPIWAVPFAFVWIFLARVALIAPLLAWWRSGIVPFTVAAFIFTVGAIVGMVPTPAPFVSNTDALRFMGALVVLVGTALAYTAMGIAEVCALVRRDPRSRSSRP